MALISARQAGTIDTTTNYSYTGADQTFTIPAGITIIKVYLWGAGGGAGYNGPAPVCTGGAGGFTHGTIAVTPGETMCVMVGQRGENASAPMTYGGGGGYGGSSSYNSSSGAGRSAIFRGGNSTTLANELATAGGGGGGGEGGGDGNAGAGGGEYGQPATMVWEYQADETAFDIGARGGSQISKGSQTGNSNYSLAGDRCRGGHGGTIPASGGGGGGYFGGGGGQQDRAGAGGSGYVGGMISGVTVQGNYWEPGGASHPLYPGGNIAYGQQTGGSSPGYHGYVIVQY